VSGHQPAALFGKPNSIAYKRSKRATVVCQAAGNPYVSCALDATRCCSARLSDLSWHRWALELERRQACPDLTTTSTAAAAEQTPISDRRRIAWTPMESAGYGATLSNGSGVCATVTFLDGARLKKPGCVRHDSASRGV